MFTDANQKLIRLKIPANFISYATIRHTRDRLIRVSILGRRIRLMGEYQARPTIKFDERFSGINWGDAKPYRDRWSELPL
jgi:hypothetical protein